MKNVKIIIKYKIKNSTSLDTSKIEYFSDIGINIFDINEEFYFLMIFVILIPKIKQI